MENEYFYKNMMKSNSKNTPTISIIIPVFNAEKTIERCIQSLQEQTYEEMEFLFIDDGSTDATSKLIKQYQASDHRIKYFFQCNSGVSSARNYGLKLAQGEYVGFCDADDWVDKDTYELLIYNLKNNKADISIVQLYYERICGSRETPFGNDNRLYVMSPSEAVCEMDKGKLFLGHIWNKLFKKEILQGIAFDKDIFMCEDTLFVHLAISKANLIVFQNSCKYHYVEMSNSLSSSRANKKYLTRRNAYLQIEKICRSNCFYSALPYVYNNIIEGDFSIAWAMAIERKLSRDFYSAIRKEIKKYMDEIRHSGNNSTYTKSFMKSIFLLDRRFFCIYAKIIDKRRGK